MNMASDNTKGRICANNQVKLDLKKSYEHLLTDIFEELLFNDVHKEQIALANVAPRTDEQAMIHAQKRIAVLQVIMAMNAEALQTRMEKSQERTESIAKDTLHATWIAAGVAIIALIVSLCS